MTTVPEITLTDRAETLLRELVRRYINDGEPVGSRTLSRESGLDLSAATIRNVMSVSYTHLTLPTILLV